LSLKEFLYVNFYRFSVLYRILKLIFPGWFFGSMWAGSMSVQASVSKRRKGHEVTFS
jgi:hypothetical protein